MELACLAYSLMSLKYIIEISIMLSRVAKTRKLGKNKSADPSPSTDTDDSEKS
jgi:hypothetical protein